MQNREMKEAKEAKEVKKADEEIDSDLLIHTARKVSELVATPEQKAISYEDQDKFFQEHRGMSGTEMQRFVRAAQQTNAFKKFIKNEDGSIKDYVTLNRHRLFVADRLYTIAEKDRDKEIDKLEESHLAEMQAKFEEFCKQNPLIECEEVGPEFVAPLPAQNDPRLMRVTAETILRDRRKNARIEKLKRHCELRSFFEISTKKSNPEEESENLNAALDFIKNSFT
jgi:hypothetical protein